MQRKTLPFQKRLVSQIAKRQHSQEGITLLESLVAIIVLTIAISVVTPPIFLAVATRVQNRKAEQAMHLAQKYVDRMQGMAREGNYDPQDDSILDRDFASGQDYPELPGQNNNQANPRQVGPPTGLFQNVLDSTSGITANCNFNAFDTSNMPPWNQGIRVDVNGDCQPDFFVQVFRSSLEQCRANRNPVAFSMGVRVYAWEARNNLGSLTNPPQEASLGPTKGFGEQTMQPLAARYTDIIYSEDLNGESLQWYEDTMNNNSDANNNC